MKLFIYIMLFVAYFFGLGMMIQDVNKDNTTPIATAVQQPCALQDAVMHDGEWYLFDKPCIFDEEVCGIMAEIFSDKINVPVAAVAEYVDGVYVIHLD